MAALITTVFAWIALAHALAINPLLLTLLIHARRKPPATSDAAASPRPRLPPPVLPFILSPLVPALVLHAVGLPISRPILAAAHLGLAAILYALCAARRLSPRRIADGCPPREILILMAVVAMLVFPYTRFTGIDTYKWQDLATNLVVEQRIPWLVHPLSLAGFTPRAYPSAQPLLLGSINVLTGHHIELGFGILSLFTAAIGIVAAWTLGRTCFPPSSGARSLPLTPPVLFAAFYVLSPVFMRYCHWATGRGLFAALSPLFLHAALLCADGNTTPRRRLAAVPLLVATGLLLLLSHKVALVFIPLTLASLVFASLLPAQPRLWLLLPATLIAIVAACAVTTPALLPPPFGSVIGLARFGLSRMGWLLPAAVPALAFACPYPAAAVYRRLTPAALLAIPLAYEAQMYGALVALPFLACFATAAAIALGDVFPAHRRVIAVTLTSLALVSALAVVIHRSTLATPARIKRAARFLERYDPRGPFTITAPGRARTQMQAYVSGCPRFDIAQAGPSSRPVRVARPPLWRGSLHATVRAWADYGRGLFEVADLAVAWYGHNPTSYVVRLDDTGPIPPNAERIYAREGVDMFRLPAGGRP